MRELGKAATKIQEQKSGGQKMSAPGRHSQKGQQADTARCPYCGFCPSEYQLNSRCLPPDTILAGKYLVGKVLGEGGFGITYMGYDLNMKTRVAIKEYFPVELVTRDTTRRSAGGGGTAFGGSGSGSAAPSASASGGSGAFASGVSSSGGGSDRVISLSGEKSKTYQQGLKKYVDEARNVSQFADIPGIVSVKDFFYENNTAYIVMEYIEGISLKEYLKQKGGKVSEEEALAILRPVLEALEKVHAAGIVHRDISPDNIMLTFMRQGNVEQAGSSDSAPVPASAASATASAAVYGNISAVKLIDFGAARMTSKNDQKSLTIILKHGYAPEEQYRSHGEQGPWTDVYALCAVLYRMLTGKVPEPAMDRLFSDGLKRPEELEARVSPAVSAAVMRGLAVKKEDRIQSVRELMDALYGGKRLKKTRTHKTAVVSLIAGGSLVVILAIKLLSGMTISEQTIIETKSKEETAAEITEISQNAEEVNLSTNLDETEEFSEVIAVASPQTSLAAGGEHILILNGNGKVTALGVDAEEQTEIEHWKNIAAVAAGSSFSVGLRADGKVMVAGSLEAAGEAERWSGITEIAAGGDLLFGLSEDGKILSSGKLGETGEYYEWENISHIACTDFMLAALEKDGTLLTYSYEESNWTTTKRENWEDVVHLVAAQHSVFGITESGDIRCTTINDSITEDTYDFSDMDSFHDIVQLYSSAGITQYGVREDGSICIGGNTSGWEQGNPAWSHAVTTWENMQGIIGIPYGNKYAGLKKDGSIVTVSENYGNSTLEDMQDLAWATFLSEEDIIGITHDQKTLSYGTDSQLFYFKELTGATQVLQLSSQWTYYVCLDKNGRMTNIETLLGESYLRPKDDYPGDFVWQNVKQMAGSPNQLFCAALFEDGSVRLLFGREEYRDRYSGLLRVEEWENIQQIATGMINGGEYIVGLNEDGTVRAVAVTVDGKEVDLSNWNDWANVSAIFSGEKTVGAILEDGTAVMLNMSDNVYGQKNISGWDNLVQLAMSENHSVGLKSDGTVVASGNNKSGQCDVGEWTDIVYIAVSNNCTLGIRKDGSLAIAGTIGW